MLIKLKSFRHVYIYKHIPYTQSSLATPANNVLPWGMLYVTQGIYNIEKILAPHSLKGDSVARARIVDTLNNKQHATSV
jgi:hypothetical protein